MSHEENRPGPGERLPGERLPGERLIDLVDIMRRLLSPDGCPWDREQSLSSLRPYLLEETYEVLEAMEHGSAADHCEELGDLLLQIVFQSALRQAEGVFGIDEVIAGIADKLIRRHPHVFGSTSAETPAEVHAQWNAIKAEEKRQARPDRPDSVLAGVPLALPALARAQKLGERAARVGFDAGDAGPYWHKLREEVAELEEAAAARDGASMEAELGDVLFTVVNLARKLGCDAESALRGANQRFATRFGYVEDRLRERGSSAEAATLEEMDALWQEAKRA